jgi:hypothetical protein
MDKKKPAVRFRIVEDMGEYFIEESRITIFGKTKWGRWQEHASWEAGYCYPMSFHTEKEARGYLALDLGARKREDKLRRRGPRVVLEVTE